MVMQAESPQAMAAFSFTAEGLVKMDSIRAGCVDIQTAVTQGKVKFCGQVGCSRFSLSVFDGFNIFNIFSLAIRCSDVRL